MVESRVHRSFPPLPTPHSLLPLAFLFTLALTLTLLTTGVNAKETKPKPQEWQIRGIEAALEDDRSGVRKLALDKLAGYESQDAKRLVKQDTFQKIANFLKDEKEDYEVRGSAANALGNLGDAVKPYINDIADLLKDEKQSSYIRGSAANALGISGNAAKPYVQDIANLLKDNKQGFYIRGRAAFILGNLGDAARPYVSDIANLLKDKTQGSDTRGDAAMALGNLGDAAKPYVSDIANLLKDKTQGSDARSEAAYALSNLGDAAKPYIPDIVNLLKDTTQYSYVRDNETAALSKLGDGARPYIPDIVNLLKDKTQDSYVRGRAAYALSNLGDAAKPYISDIADLLKDKSLHPYARRSAAIGLSKLDNAAKPYIPDLLSLVKDETQDYEVRSDVANALCDLGEVAKPYIPDLLSFIKDKKQDYRVRSNAAYSLGRLGNAAKPYIPDLLSLVKDETQYYKVRGGVVYALGKLGDTAKPYIPSIISFIKNKTLGSSIRGDAAYGLGNLEKLDADSIMPIINRLYEKDSPVDQGRFDTYFFSGGDEYIKSLLMWIGRPIWYSKVPNHEKGVETLKLLEKAWKPSAGLYDLQRDLAETIIFVVRMTNLQPKDTALLKRHYDNLRNSGFTQAAFIQEVIAQLEGWQWIFRSWQIILTHALFWLALIFAYPKSPQIQAIFFWNPWVRTILGFGYVSFLLTWIPFLRRKLFAPFRFSLLADAGLNHFNPDTYFSESNVRELAAGDEQPIMQVISEIKGQVILEGDSGLGKTMFLRHLLQQSQRIVVYLPATKCAEGVIEAIQKKLHGDEIKDTKFLQSLIYSGAIDICIDGLNEVNPDTRAKITQFVESHFKGNILMTTQPLEWLPPSTAKTYVMQPLQSEQIKRYLLSRQPSLPKAAPVQGTAYEQACRTFLDTMLSDQTPLSSATTQVTESSESTAETPPSPQSWGNQTIQSPPNLGDLGGAKELHAANLSSLSPEELKTSRTILSNPMELTLAAWMLAGGVQPDLFNLREQQYKLMAEDYRRTWNQDFPLKQFSEAVYQQWLLDQKELPKDKFYNELLCMEDEKFRMVVSRQWKDAKGEAKKEWYFRHDKIAEFFLVQTFLGKGSDAETRLLDHIGDSRFRGVYFLLATLMDLEAAKDLREKLIQYAADTKDHTVSDTFVQLLRSR